ncbi:MAG: putative lipase [Thermoleophilia bacterium]|nr:putative lipase [Thermoleophilia bacterium]
MLLACSLAGVLLPTAAQSATIRVVRNVQVPTADGGSIPVDVWRPGARTVARASTVTLRPVALLVHGGGWHTGDKSQWEQSRWAQRLAARGWLVVNANYRLACAADGTTATGTLDADEVATMRRDGRSGRTTRDPRMCGHALRTSIADVRQALRYTSTHARGWGGDPRRIVMYGASAGGHLAMLAASDPARPAGLLAVVALSPPTDLVTVGADPSLPIHGSARLAIGCDLATCPEQWRLASPFHRIRRGVTVPTWVFDAGSDPITPLAPARAYVMRLRGLGIASTLVTTADLSATCHGPIPCAGVRLAGSDLGLFEHAQAWLRPRL